MADKVKCRYCKKEIDKNTAYKVGDKSYYCNADCYHKQTSKKPKSKPKKNFKNNNPAIKDLTDYIQELYVKQGYKKEKINWALIGSQIKHFMEDNKDWTYGGIQYTLNYMIESDVNLFGFTKGSILNLVPYYYYEAKAFCYEMVDLYEELENIEEDDVKVIKGHNRKTNINVEF